MLFKDDYFFLSTFYPCAVTVEIEGKNYLFKNVESAFQAQKNPAVATKFSLFKGLEAKRVGEKIPATDPNWSTNQIYAMAKALHSKFKNIELFLKLYSIKDDIINDNFWGDTFWGVYKGEGLNILGKLLMNIRDNKNDFSKLFAYISLELLKYV